MQTARDIMSQKVIKARPGMTCEQVRDLLVSNKISGLPVVDSKGVLLGVISMSDILNSALNGVYNDRFPEPRILDQLLEEEGFQLEQTAEGYASDMMTRSVIRAFPETPVPKLAELMYTYRIHRVIIVEPHSNKVVGIVTAYDLLKVLMGMAQICDNYRNQHRTPTTA